MSLRRPRTAWGSSIRNSWTPSTIREGHGPRWTQQNLRSTNVPSATRRCGNLSTPAATGIASVLHALSAGDVARTRARCVGSAYTGKGPRTKLGMILVRAMAGVGEATQRSLTVRTNRAQGTRGQGGRGWPPTVKTKTRSVPRAAMGCHPPRLQFRLNEPLRHARLRVRPYGNMSRRFLPNHCDNAPRVSS